MTAIAALNRLQRYKFSGNLTNDKVKKLSVLASIDCKLCFFRKNRATILEIIQFLRIFAPIL